LPELAPLTDIVIVNNEIRLGGRNGEMKVSNGKCKKEKEGGEGV